MRAEWPFLRSGCRLGSIEEQTGTKLEVAVSEAKRAKNSDTTERKFRTSEPKILYFGTPVALLSSRNEDASTDLALISSFWSLGWTLLLGLLSGTKTADKVARHRECVVNLPSPEMWQNVEKLAPLTGKNPVPKLKSKQYRFKPHKPGAAELAPLTSEAVKPARARECPVHMEARVITLHERKGEKLSALGGGIAAEVEVARVPVADDFILQDKYIDPAKWLLLIHNFRHYFRLADQELGKTFRAEAQKTKQELQAEHPA